MEISDEQLLASYVNGCNDSFRQLHERYHRPLRNAVYRYVRDRHIAEDIVQIAFLKLHQNRGKFGNHIISKVLHRIAVNEAKDYLRKKKQLTANQSEVVDNHDQFKQMVDAEIAANIRQTLAKLPTPDRNAITLAFFEGKTNDEASKVLDMPKRNVRVRLNAAIARFKNLLTNSMKGIV